MADVAIRWHLELVGDPSRQLLRQDRAIRSSITQTDRLQRKLATSARDTGTAQLRAGQTAARGLKEEARAAATARSDVAALNRAQAEALSSGGRLLANARRVASAYREQASAAKQASTAERARQRAQAATGRLASGALGVGAGASAGLQRTLAIAAGGGVAAKVIATFAGFEQQMDRVSAVSGATTKQMAAMSAEAKDLGRRTSFSAREAADGMYELSTAGFKANEVMRIIPGTLSLAAASGQDLASSAELQAASIRAFGLRAGDATRVADVLATTVNRSAVEMDDLGEALKYVGPIARASGQSFESINAALGIMGNVGVKGSQAGTTLRTALVRMTNPTLKAEGALKDLGIRAEQLRGPRGLKPLPQIMGMLADGARKVDKGTRNAALATIFGREALSGMVALVEKGPAAYDRNIRALEHTRGAAVRTAHIMRDNVAGAWDNFTGSLETAAITLTERFGPALKRTINAAATDVNRLATGTGDVLTGLGAGITDQRARRGAPRADGMGVAPRGAAEQSSGIASAAQRLGETLRHIGGDFSGVGDNARDFVHALAPAKPLLDQLGPLAEGAGGAIAGTLTVGLKAAAPPAHLLAISLGEVGKFLDEHPGAAHAAGAALLIFAARSALVTGATSRFGRAIKLLTAPVRLASGLILGLGKRLLATRAGLAAADAIVGPIGRVPGRLAGPLGRIATTMLASMGLAGTRAGEAAATNTVVGAETATAAGGLRGRLRGLGHGMGGLVGAAFGVVLMDNILKAFDRGGLRDAIAEYLNPLHFGNQPRNVKPYKPPRGAPPYRPDAGPLRIDTGAGAGNYGGNHRRGGIIAFGGGGLVPAYVSPGELLSYGDAAMTVPGPRTNADSVFAMLPPGTAVYTDDGQARLAAGMSPSAVLASQAPHFQGGGVVHPGRYSATSYGPPWGGIQGTGVTATGVRLTTSPHLYGVAVDPAQIPLGSGVYAWPNPFGYTGAFRAFDTGGAIQGRRLDFYDWRGRGAQNQWGRRDVNVSSRRLLTRPGESGAQYGVAGGAGAVPTVTILRASRRRSGLLPDAFQQGLQAGQEGLTRSAIATEGSPILPAIAQAIAATQPRSQATRYKGAGKLPGGVYVPSADWNPRRRPIARWIVPYLTYAHSHGWHGTVTSGYRSRAEQAGLYSRGGGGPVARPGTSNHEGTTYPRGAVDVTAASAPQLAAALARKPPPHLLQWAGAKDPVHFSHPHAGSYRRGGLIRRYRTGGVSAAAGVETPRAGRALSLATNRAYSFAGHSLEALDTIIGGAMERKLLALRHAVTAAAQRGGPQRVVQRLQSIIDLVNFELGRRVGRILDIVAARTRTIERAAGGQDRYLRRAGVDPSSARGIAMQAFRGAVTDVPNAQANVRSLRSALARATREGDRTAQRDIRTQLEDAQDALDEALTTQAERRRDLIRAIAQERVDNAEHTVSLVQGAQGALDATQRLTRTTDTPEGMRQRAAAIQTGLLPALQAQGAALGGQLAAARQNGDVPGMRAADLALQSNANDLANALADAGDLLRDAATKAAQDIADAAEHRLSVAQGSLTGLDAAQRLAPYATAPGASIGGLAWGTIQTLGQAGAAGADTPEGMRQRAAAIQSALLPALAENRAALFGQANTASANGDLPGMRAAELALQSNANDLASAVADAADLLRDAAIQGAQNVVDAAAHTTNLAQSGLQRLELEQRLAGTYDAGGAARADYIRAQILPDLQAELAGLQAVEQAQREQGSPIADLRQTIESEAAKRNEILQASLDTQEQIASNTEPRKFGGTLGFTYGGETLTDSLVTIGNGL